MAIATKELTKKEQLEIALRTLLEGMTIKLLGIIGRGDRTIIAETSDLILKEVSIRTDLR